MNSLLNIKILHFAHRMYVLYDSHNKQQSFL